ncbi:MAG: spermidine/putrescine ABC transporter permease [Alkaliphilus sp.]|nr:MAG: spermidine/putrescine ABC transporter permease [Alkaliphilus sp.]
MYKKLKPYLMLLPVMVVMSVFILGLISAVLQSFGYIPVFGMSEITLRHYINILESRSFLRALGFGIYISFASSGISVFIGTYVAYLIYRNKKETLWVRTLYKIPIAVPHAIAALLVFIILTQSGVLSRIFYNLGLIDNLMEFPELIFDRGGIGIIIAYTWKGIPFIMMITLGILKKIDARLVDTALNLGASKKEAWWQVEFPMILPTVLTGFILLFAFSFGAFEVPFLIGPSAPRALPVVAYIQYTSIDLSLRPQAMVINVIISTISLMLVYVYILAFRSIKKYFG